MQLLHSTGQNAVPARLNILLHLASSMASLAFCSVIGCACADQPPCTSAQSQELPGGACGYSVPIPGGPGVRTHTQQGVVPQSPFTAEHRTGILVSLTTKMYSKVPPNSKRRFQIAVMGEENSLKVYICEWVHLCSWRKRYRRLHGALKASPVQ